MSRSVQYPRPRCPHCKQYRRLCLGYDLREVMRTPQRVRIQCQNCYYSWWSTNAAALGGVLAPVPADRLQSPQRADSDNTDSTAIDAIRFSADR